MSQVDLQSNEIKKIIKLMPEELRNEGIQLQSEMEAIYWRIGDWVNNVYAWALAEGFASNKKTACASCAAILQGVDLHADTLYNYARVAEHYPADRRSIEVLPFSHLLYAAGFGENSKEVIDYDLKLMEERGGAPASLSKIKDKYEAHRQGVPLTTYLLHHPELSADDKTRARQLISAKIKEIEALLESASVLDAEGAIWIARGLSWLRRAVDKITKVEAEKWQQ
jgi:hypothetical protein